MVITPAYGRDYKSKVTFLADWEADKDFLVQPDGCYINKSDAIRENLDYFQVRYGKLRKVGILKLTKQGWRL